MRESRKRALLLTYHNWEGYRQGGFHKLAEALCADGYEVGFLSYPRPWYGALKRSDREGWNRLWKQLQGQVYSVRGSVLTNFTTPTLGLPGRIRRFFGDKVSAALDRTTFPPIGAVCRKRFPFVELVVFESTRAILLFEHFRRQYPGALIAYRPSDPLIGDPACARPLREAERSILKRADLVLLVDESSKAMYQAAFPDVDMGDERIKILPNGVDLASFQTRHAPPDTYGSQPIALYIGAHSPDWAALAAAAQALPSITFVVVCPEQAARHDLEVFLANPNCRFVPGIPPRDVARYVTSSDVVLVPYPRTHPRVLTLGVTAKLLQAMAARKPIVGLFVNQELQKHGVAVCHSQEDFVAAIKTAVRSPAPTYPLEVREYEWGRIEARFLGLVQRNTVQDNAPLVEAKK